MPGLVLNNSIGSGPDLVMLHGWGAHSGVWGRFADCLASEFRLHLVDLPGHGRSRDEYQEASLRSFADEVGDRFPGAHWLGWSLGGLLALATALRSPGRIDRLVLISASASFLKKPHWPDGMSDDDFNAFRSGIEQDHLAALKRFAALQGHGTGGASEVRQELQACLDAAEPSKAALLEGLDTLAVTDLSAGLDRMQNPVMLISGDRDLVAAPVSVEQTARRIPGAVYRSVPDAGHAPFISHPSELCALVGGFLRQERPA